MFKRYIVLLIIKVILKSIYRAVSYQLPFKSKLIIILHENQYKLHKTVIKMNNQYINFISMYGNISTYVSSTSLMDLKLTIHTCRTNIRQLRKVWALESDLCLSLAFFFKIDLQYCINFRYIV